MSVREARAPNHQADATARRDRLPDFFIVGPPKSGTTALYEMLRPHPQIFLPASKEPWFFADELQERTPPRPSGTPRTLAEYVRWFDAARPGQRKGDASPLYLWSRTAASRIAAVQPGAQIVAILREPASFLYSLHLQFVQSYIEVEPDLRKALALEQSRREGRNVPRYTYWPRALLYSDHVRYVEQLRRYHDAFSREQVLVLIYEQFRDDNDASVRAVLRFLGLDDSEPISPRVANPTMRVRSARMYEALHAVSVGRGPVSRAVKATVREITPRRLRRGLVRAIKRNLLFGEPAAPDEELMAALRVRFKPEVEALGEYLGRDLVSFWGYERVG